jgi:hypothetical protein
VFALCTSLEIARRVADAMTATVAAEIGGETGTFISPIPARGARVLSTCAS